MYFVSNIKYANWDKYSFPSFPWFFANIFFLIFPVKKSGFFFLEFFSDFSNFFPKKNLGKFFPKFFFRFFYFVQNFFSEYFYFFQNFFPFDWFLLRKSLLIFFGKNWAFVPVCIIQKQTFLTDRRETWQVFVFSWDVSN